MSALSPIRGNPGQKRPRDSVSPDMFSPKKPKLEMDAIAATEEALRKKKTPKAVRKLLKEVDEIDKELEMIEKMRPQLNQRVCQVESGFARSKKVMEKFAVMESHGK